MPTTDINHLALTYGLLAEDIAILLELALLLAVPFTIWLGIWGFSKLGEMDGELRLLTVGRGWEKVRLDEFAIRCSVHVAFARWYLNSKAQQLNGLREVDELRDVVYLFGEAKRKFLHEHLALLSPERERTYTGGTP
jgi:hypothetical protein